MSNTSGSDQSKSTGQSDIGLTGGEGSGMEPGVAEEKPENRIWKILGGGGIAIGMIAGFVLWIETRARAEFYQKNDGFRLEERVTSLRSDVEKLGQYFATMSENQTAILVQIGKNSEIDVYLAKAIQQIQEDLKALRK